MTVEAAVRAKQADIDITSIGIGGWVNVDELDIIAGFPTSTHKILVDDFDKLPTWVRPVKQNVCGGRSARLCHFLRGRHLLHSAFVIFNLALLKF